MFIRPEVRRTFWALLGASVLTLLVACANVANLQLSKTESRQHELAIRSAVGAGRMRLVRQLLTESVLLAVIGGLAGLAVTAFGLTLLEKLRSPDLPHFKAISLNLGVFVIASLISIGTGVVFGMAPAWRSFRAELADADVYKRQVMHTHALEQTVAAQVREELRRDLRADLMTALDPEREVKDGFQKQLRLIVQSDMARANSHQYRDLMQVVQRQRQQDHGGVLALIKDVREQQITAVSYTHLNSGAI